MRQFDLLVAFSNGVEEALALLLSLHGLFIKDEQEDEGGALTPFGNAGDVTAELLDDLLADMKSKTDTLGVQLFCILKKAKQFEELALILLLDTNAVINDLDFESSMVGFLDQLIEFLLLLKR